MGEQSLRDIKNALTDLPHEFISVIPFSREITANVPIEGVDYIPYGSTLLTTLAHDLKWKGCHFDLERFNYVNYLNNRDDMLNGGYYRIDEAIKYLERCEDRQFFIRPSLDLKQFAGTCMNADEAAVWLKNAMTCDSTSMKQLTEDTILVVSEPKKILAEWRWFIVGGDVIDGSMYRSHGQLIKRHETDFDVINEAQSFADKWLPDENCVMDLALTPDGVFVIEFNCLNSSGFYNHDIKKIFTALYKYHTHIPLVQRTE